MKDALDTRCTFGQRLQVGEYVGDTGETMNAARSTQHAARSTQLFVLLALIFASQVAAAQARVQEVNLTPIWWEMVVVQAFELVTIDTNNLSSGADTVLHVWDDTTGTQVTWNDDHNGQARSSVTWWNGSSSARTYRVFVRAASWSTSGTADLRRNSAILRVGIPVGGNVVNVVDGANFIHETVGRPMSTGGLNGAIVLGLNATGAMTGYDFNGGLGAHARFSATSATSHVVVGAWPDDTGGFVRLISHNPADDPDNDGVDSAVETQLGTCAGNGVACPYGGVHTTADTDRDGISDGAEIFGLASPNGDMHLPRWGANPRRKDVFVEIDFRADLGTTNPFAAMSTADLTAFVASVRNAFEDSSGGDIRNPDGTPGIWVHIDAGVGAPQVSHATTIGSWGGGGSFVSNPSMGRIAARANFMDTARQPVFRYALATAGGGGQASHGAFEWGFGAFGGSGTVGNFVHELGHTCGLMHWGHDFYTPSLKNGSPGYDSLMNYCHQHAGQLKFSDGDGSASINPANTNELSGIQATIPATRFEGWPWNLAVMTGPTRVDFTRDAIYSSAVRAPVTWCATSADHALANELQDQVFGTGANYTITPALARGPGSRLYAFYLNGTSLRYKSAPYSSTLDGSCPNGDGIRDDTVGGAGCMTWASYVTVSPPSGVTVASVSVAPWATGLAIVIGGTNSQVYTGFWSSNSGATLTGFTGWIDQGPGYGEVEISPMHVDSAVYGASLALGIFYLNPTNQFITRTATSTPPVYNLADYVRRTDGTIVNGSIGAAVAPWPTVEYLSNHATVATACAVFPNTAQYLRVYCLERGNPNRRWIDMTNAALNCAGCIGQPQTSQKPDLRFHIIRKPDGSPLFTTYRGNFWLTWQPLASTVGARIAVSDWLNSTNPPATQLRFNHPEGYFGNEWTPSSGGISLYDDLTLGAMKALWVWNHESGSNQLRFSPTADGSLDAELGDANDWRIMEHGVCRMDGARSASLCGTNGSWGF